MGKITKIRASDGRVSTFLGNTATVKHSFDHSKTLTNTASLVEEIRLGNNLPDIGADQFETLMCELRKATDVAALVSTLGTCDKAVQDMAKVVERRCLEELMTLSSVDGPLPLKDWPVDLSKNWYCEVIQFAAQHSPTTLSLLVRLVLKDVDTGVLPRHILSLATIFAQIGKEVDKTNNVLALIQALSLKMDGLVDKGLDGQAKVGLSATARALRYKRDELAEVSGSMLLEESRAFPSQITLDNCNTQRADCIVAYNQTETQDTSHLSVEGMTLEETMALFDPSIFMLATPQLQDEFDHLKMVVMLAAGRELAVHLPDQVGHWLKVLPEQHGHPQSKLPLEKAKITLLPPMHYKVNCPFQLYHNMLLTSGNCPKGHDPVGKGAPAGKVESPPPNLQREQSVCERPPAHPS